MPLYLAVDEEVRYLDYIETDTESQAWHEFHQEGIYPAHVIKLPDSLATRVELDDVDDFWDIP